MSVHVLVFLWLCFWTSIITDGKVTAVMVSASEGGVEAWCVDIRDKYAVLPGKSFGTLPTEMHKVYLHRRCDRFFCEPHALAGKGVFECVPLKNKAAA